MVCYNKTNKEMARFVVLALVIAVIGVFLMFALYKWMQQPVIETKSATAVPKTSQAVTVQPVTTPIAQATIPAVEPTDLETLVAPVALYPDLLLAQIIPASTYPMEVVQAARWLGSKPDLTQASEQDWAPSITVLLQFPQIIFMMNDQLEWTAELGDRFLAEPDSVLAAIQSMRARAMTTGLLKDSPEQKVTKVAVTKLSIGNQQVQGAWFKVPAAPKAAQTRKTEVIRIEPANPQVIYVPRYNPLALYRAPPAPVHYPDAGSTPVYDTTTSQASPWLTFGPGVATGALLGWTISEWNDDEWDDNYHSYYRQPYISHYSGNSNGYSGGTDNVNIFRNIDISGSEINGNHTSTLNRLVPKPWAHDPLHRHGYPYPPQAQQPLDSSTQQPALAGQRRATGQAVNPDYAGYDRDNQDRVQQRTQDRAFSEVPQNKKTATVSQHLSTQLAERLSTEKSEELAKAIPHSARTSEPKVELTYFTNRSFETPGVFSGVSEGRQAQKYSKRGLTSRTEGHTGSSHDGRKGK